ncbi:probable serine/threonine-protein kinase irlF [Triplophysa rosa]|uniref:probable serine/threonine-protein kinase irlF n=1 Tax=Triplophysa rosa TaxID=992332 RepID=UPI002545F6D4|nr:probable serine/threonine-protein kinase irlF [Triplophysa rosa]XP_057201674.1 probable serine/threonine-protein kinase irlF [Triplophysa rosa]
MAHQDFVDFHFAVLINRVTNVMPIADKLLEKRMLSTENYSKIKNEKTSQGKMRELLPVVKSGGPEVKSYFYEVLKLNEPYLVQDLESPSSQASSGVLQSQEETQDTPEDVLMWNQSSKKHSSTIKELQNDRLKKLVGSIYFSRNEKYFIGSGSSGTQVYLGLKTDGTEVAIKRITKNPLNNKTFENELKHLQDLNLESKNIVRYVDFAEDDDFYYLALQLCECDLESYMEDLRKPEHKDKKDAALKKIVKDVLIGLRDLHHGEVIHRDLNPKNVLIDSGNNARLADFGLSRKLEEGSAVYTAKAGTRGWEAVETLGPSGDSRYRMSSDVQVAGMLMYYILTDGKHPFDVNNSDRETNIREGKYSLDDALDIVAQDLIKRMINIDPAQRPTMDEALQHPYFWDDVRKDAVLRKLGDREEVQCYVYLEEIYNLYKQMENRAGGNPTATLTLDEAIEHLEIPKNKREEVRKGVHKAVGDDVAKLKTLCDTAKKYSVKKSFSTWKTDLSQIWTSPKDINQRAPEDLLVLFRFMRNKLVHEKLRFDEKKLLNQFPDFFISLHRLAKELSWDY